MYSRPTCRILTYLVAVLTTVAFAMCLDLCRSFYPGPWAYVFPLVGLNLVAFNYFWMLPVYKKGFGINVLG